MSYPFPLFQFRFASPRDRFLVFLGVISALIGGCSMPVMIMLFGDLANIFVQNSIDTTQICDYFAHCCEGTM